MVRVLTAGGLKDLDPLIKHYPFKPYRNYRTLSRRLQEDVLRAELEAALRREDGVGIVADDDGPQAAAFMHPMSWDGAFFGITMARLQVLHRPETSRPIIRSVVESAVQLARERDIDHLSARIDVADVYTVQVLEETGFRIMDSLATYIYHHKRQPPAPLKEMGIVRPFRAEDTDQILDITRQAYRGFRGRYHLDPHLSEERSDQLYVEWARKCCAREWADVILVTENEAGDIHGWASYRRIEPVSSIGGTAICGAGLGACRRDKPGAYAGLIRAATVNIHASGAVTECQTQIFNFATIRIYESVGTQFVRADHTLHSWLR